MTSSEDRIQRLEDRAALYDLVVCYFLATDDDDFSALERCFSPDVTFIASGFVGGAGRAKVLEFLRLARSGMKQTVHTPNYLHLKSLGVDEASGVVGAHLEIGMGDETLYAAVRYFDSYRKVDGRWVIASREMKAVHVGPWDKVNTSLSQPFNVRWPGQDAGLSDLPRSQK